MEYICDLCSKKGITSLLLMGHRVMHVQTGALIPVLEQFILTFPPTGMFLGSGRKPKKPNESHLDTGNMCIESTKR